MDERIQLYEEEKATATEAEVAAYLSTASLSFPLDHDQAQVYFYVVNRVMKRRNTEVPKDLVVTDLSSDQVRLFEKLRRDIYNSRLNNAKK